MIAISHKTQFDTTHCKRLQESFFFKKRSFNVNISLLELLTCLVSMEIFLNRLFIVGRMMMQRCTSCGGFIPPHIQNCPHCHTKKVVEEKSLNKRSSFKKWRNALIAVVGGGSLMLTMMACYGPSPSCENKVDNDKDGYFVCSTGDSFYGEKDCDDSNKDIHPGAKDTVGDGIDQNCDGVDGVKEDSTR